MAAIFPSVQVADPAPQTPRYGMLGVATPIDLPEHAVAGGVTYRTVVTDLPEGFDVTCSRSVVTFKDPCGDWITGTPFLVQANLTEGSIGDTATPDQVRAALLARLFAGEQPIVEQIFADGLVGASPSLANNTPNATTLGASVGLVDAFGALEAWIYARQGPRAVLHVPLQLAARCQYLNLVSQDPARTWRTALGTAVVFGNYSGNAPAGGAPAAGTLNLYVSGSLSVWREPDSQVFVTPYPGFLEPHTNQVYAYARRGYVVTHNGLLAATAATIRGCECEDLPA